MEDEVGLDEKRWTVQKIANRISVLTSSMSDVIRTAPLNFRQSQARKLFEEGHFIRNSKLRLALFLVSRNITEADLVARIAPDLEYVEFKKLEGIVNAEIDKTLPEKAKKFRKFLGSLTAAQREALEQVYLKNEYGLTQESVAKKLNISIDSLSDRLEGAKRKLKAFYPELRKEKKGTKRDKQYTVLPPNEHGCELEPGSNETVVFQIDPVTRVRKRLIVEKTAKKRIHYKPDVDRFAIRRWIRDRCPIPYTAI